MSGRLLRDTALAVAAVVGALCVLTAVAMIVFGIRPVVFWLERPPTLFAGGILFGAWLTWWLHRPWRHKNDSDPGGHTMGPASESGPGPRPATHRAIKAGAPLAVLALVSQLIIWAPATQTVAQFSDSADLTSSFSTEPPTLIAQAGSQTMVTDGSQAAILTSSSTGWQRIDPPNLTARFLSGANDRFFVSDGRQLLVRYTTGSSWQRASLPSDTPIAALFAQWDPTDTNLVFLIVTDGVNWWISGDNGATWSPQPPSTPYPTKFVDAAGTGTGTVIWVLASGRTGLPEPWTSTDYGKTWARIEAPSSDWRVLSGSGGSDVLAWGSQWWIKRSIRDWQENPGGFTQVPGAVDIAGRGTGTYMILDPHHEVWQVAAGPATAIYLGRPY